MELEFRWYCPLCRQALGIDRDDVVNYARLWRGPEYEYVHTVRGFEHKLRVTDGQELYPERGLVGVYLDGKIIVVPWRRMMQ